MRFEALAIVFILATATAGAHEWYSDQYNELGYWCCSGDDCGIIPDADVNAVRGGYFVNTLFKGTEVHEFVPNARARPAPETGNYHLCLWQNKVRCFFFPAPSY